MHTTIQRELNANIDYLAANPMELSNPQPGLPSSNDKQSDTQLHQLKKTASAQSQDLIASGKVGGIINNNIPNGECKKCGWVKDRRVVAQFEEKTKTVVDNSTCVSCNQKIAQQQKMIIRNEHLQNMFKAQLASQYTPSTDRQTVQC